MMMATADKLETQGDHERAILDLRDQLKDLRAEFRDLRMRVDEPGPKLSPLPAGYCTHGMPPGSYCPQCGDRVE